MTDNDYTPAGLIAMIRRVHSPRGRRLAGLYAIEGTRLIERALRAGAALEAVLAAESFISSADPRRHALRGELAAAGCPITVVADETVSELTEGRDLGPILGLVRFPPTMTLAELVATTDSQPPTTTNESPPVSYTHLDVYKRQGGQRYLPGQPA